MLESSDSDILQYQKTVCVLAQQEFNRNYHWVSFDDLVQECWETLIRATRTFDPSKDVTFKTYANSCIRYRLLNFIHEYHAPVRAGHTEKDGKLWLKSSHEIPEQPSEKSAEDELLEIEEFVLLQTAMLALTAREQDVLRSLFWKLETTQSVGNRLGVVRSRVYQIRDRAILKLRAHFTATENSAGTDV